MKIKNISCTQFAGIRDRSVSFADGINVIYGKNESGKSTLVNMLGRTLFQNAKLDRRSDKDFENAYLPGERRGGGVPGDFADGEITFETERGAYTLSKEWSKTEPRCILRAPDGSLREQEQINAVLKDALVYGEGVYADMLFSSQRGSDSALQALLDASNMDASKKTTAKQEIVDAVSQAFAESGGISMDALAQAIAAKIDELAGQHWDFEQEAPARKTTGAGRWVSGLGEILKAYYALEDAKAVCDKISQLESDLDLAAGEYAEKDSAARTAEEAYRKFNVYKGRLDQRSAQEKAVARLQSELGKIAEDLADWPNRAAVLDKAKALQTEKANRELLNRYERAKQVYDEVQALAAKSGALICPSDAELAQVKAAQREAARLENELCGMNLTAAVRMLGGNQVHITSLRTGEEIDISGGTAAIAEAVQITVPGIMEMRLSPADVDAEAVRQRLGEQEGIIRDIFAKYRVETAEALEQLAQTASEVSTKLDTAKARLAMLLGSTEYEALESAASAVTAAVRPMDEIEADTFSVCRDGDIDKFVTKTETVIEGYTADYGSLDALSAKKASLEAELTKAKEAVSAAEDIPAEYLGVADSDAYLEELRREREHMQSLRDKALEEKTAAASRLESSRESVSGDPADEVEKAERIFEEQKSLLSHWKHIEQVFRTQREALHDNPMQDIADSFARYLGVISGGSVSSEFPQADQLNMNIFSEDRLLDYNKLSEGTKETVFLAFRLAVLDHLFPDGGGVIVLDDPLTDMDAERAAQSCRLIRECAARHQVIFLTCREEYSALLGGNHIDL